MMMLASATKGRGRFILRKIFVITLVVVGSNPPQVDGYAYLTMNGSSSPSSAKKSVGCNKDETTRRSFFGRTAFAVVGGAGMAFSTGPTSPLPSKANALGPTKVGLNVLKYSAAPCPPSRPIPGEKAMKGMRGLCVTVSAELAEPPPKDLDKVGVYGFVTDAISGDSVLANNPDLSTDAGQFAMIESVTPKDTKVEFDFVAAIPMENDISQFENGIGELSFGSLRIISFPGGEQYGAISPCEMNEFSAECEEWEEENGPYEKAKYMMKSNVRTKGR